MKIAVAQINTRVGDFDASSKRIKDLASSAAAQGGELLVFGVPVLTGPNPGNLSESEEFFMDLTECLTQLAQDLSIPTLIPIVMSVGRESVYEAVLLKDGNAWPLRLMSWHGLSNQAHAFSDDLNFEIGNVSFGIAFDIHSLERYAHGRISADCILYLPLYCLNTNDEMTFLAPSVADGCFVSEAGSANAWIAAVASVGGYDEQVFGGGSFVMSPWGELAWAAPSFEEALGVVDVDPLFEGPIQNPASVPSYQRIKSLWDTLVLGTRDFFAKEGLSDVAVVLDGTLNSATTSALLVDSLGPTHVHARISPELGDTLRDATLELARNLRIEISEELDSSWLLVSAYDKTSYALEARSAMDQPYVFAPFGDVYRTDLIALARQRNTISPVIPNELFKQLNVPKIKIDMSSYANEEAAINAIDAVLLLHIERSLGLTRISRQQANIELIEEILERINKQTLFRRTMPNALVVSDRSLSERDWPIGLGWKDRPRENMPTDLEGMSGFAERMFGQLMGEATIEEEFDPEAEISDVLGLLGELGGMSYDFNDVDESNPFDIGLFSDN